MPSVEFSSKFKGRALPPGRRPDLPRRQEHAEEAAQMSLADSLLITHALLRDHESVREGLAENPDMNELFTQLDDRYDQMYEENPVHPEIILRDAYIHGARFLLSHAHKGNLTAETAPQPDAVLGEWLLTNYETEFIASLEKYVGRTDRPRVLGHDEPQVLLTRLRGNYSGFPKH